MKETIRENERLGESYIIPKGERFEIPLGSYDLEVWPIIRSMPGDAMIMGYVIRLIEQPEGASDGDSV